MRTSQVFCCCGGLAFVGMLAGAGLGFLTKWLVFRKWPDKFATPTSQKLLLWLACVVWAVILIGLQFVVLMAMGSQE
jgi:hypothetical protein